MGFVFSSGTSVRGDEVSSDAGVNTAEYVVPASRVTAPEAGAILQAESEKLFGSSNGEKIQRVSESRASEESNTGKGNSSSKVRAQAVESLPLRHLSAEAQGRTLKIVKDAGFFRRLPTVVIPSESESYCYFLNYPESAVSIWRAMGISTMQLEKTGSNTYRGDAGDGTFGSLEVLYQNADHVLVICDGEYKSPFLKKPIIAQSVLHLETNFFRETDGQVYVTHRADLFVTFPSQAVETVARVLAPLTSPIADRSFVEVSMFLKMMSMAMVRRPDWVEEMASRMEGIPEDRKTKLLEVTELIRSREESRVTLAGQRGVPHSRFSKSAASRIPATPVSRSGELATNPERTSQSVPFRK